MGVKTKLQILWWTIAFLVLGLFVNVLTNPWTFQIHDRISKPARFRGYPVVRYGHSHFHQVTYRDGRYGSTEEYLGRSFVDYRVGTRIERTYGWRLEGKVPLDRSPVLFTLE